MPGRIRPPVRDDRTSRGRGTVAFVVELAAMAAAALAWCVKLGLAASLAIGLALTGG